MHCFKKRDSMHPVFAKRTMKLEKENPEKLLFEVAKVDLYTTSRPSYELGPFLFPTV